jgi:cell division transport system permease protein
VKVLTLRVHALRETFRLLRRRPGSFLLGVLLAASAFTPVILSASILRSTAPLVGSLALSPEASLFLSGATPAAEIAQLQARLALRPGVAGVEWITREQALQAVAQRTGAAVDLAGGVLPDVLIVRFAPDTTPAGLEQALEELRHLPRVDSVAADTGWHRKLATLRNVGAIAGGVGAALATALLLLIALASVRLQVATSLAEAQVLRLVGADSRFIVRPYAYAGALTLAGGAALAAALTGVALAVMSEQFSELAGLYGVALSLEPLPAPWVSASVAAAAVAGGSIAAAGARWSLRTLP